MKIKIVTKKPEFNFKCRGFNTQYSHDLTPKRSGVYINTTTQSKIPTLDNNPYLISTPNLQSPISILNLFISSLLIHSHHPKFQYSKSI